jgi:hypothetical protein
MTPADESQWLQLRDDFISAALKLSEQFTPEHHTIIFKDWNDRLRAMQDGSEHLMRPISAAAWKAVWLHLVYGTKLEFSEANARFYLGAEKAHLN